MNRTRMSLEDEKKNAGDRCRLWSQTCQGRAVRGEASSLELWSDGDEFFEHRIKHWMLTLNAVNQLVKLRKKEAI